MDSSKAAQHERKRECAHCNMALGLLQDNEERILALAAYLRRYASPDA